jgi:crotonobetainyl-CoA:carnitine CoA-transferase CaiB-like acyl-CoA transferase
VIEMTRPNGAQSDRSVGSRTGPLSGVRVADFCWMGVGSVATRLLGDFGAEVIKIETRKRIDTPRRLPFYKDGSALTYGQEVIDCDPNKGGLFNNYCRNKLGVTIDLGSPAGRDVAERLISACSVVTENFAPGVMERWGFTYERLQELSPGVIYARMSGYGHSGPHQHYRSYGPTVQAVSGLSFVSGLPNREPSGWGFSYMDNQAAFYNSLALLVALLRRTRTGAGAEVDVSSVEVGVSLLGPILEEVAINGRRTRGDAYPTGNRLEWPQAAPHGVYPAAGEDQWIAIAVFEDEQWRQLAELINEGAATDERFATAAGRFAAHDELDQIVSAWSVTQNAADAAETLQRRGVPAGRVQNGRDLVENDPQLAHLGTFFELDHPVIGPAKFEGVPLHFSRMRPDHWRSAPLLGEDNEYVFKQIVGLADAEYDDLVIQGVI